jgi:hypothetical protein
MRRLFACLAVATTLGCSSDRPTAPSPTPGPASGTWTGSAIDAVNGSGTLRLELTELTIDARRGLVGGTWRADFAATGATTGTVAGLRNDASIEIMLEPLTPPPCPPASFRGRAGTFWAALTRADDAIAGAYTYQSCDAAAPGALTLRRP